MAGGASLIALGTAAYVLGSDLLGSVYNAAKSRAAVTIPAPTSSVPRARGTGFDVNGLAPYITANKDFYRVDTALVVPQLSTEGYTLALHGKIDRPTIFTFDDLLGMGLIERTITMVCVSNPVGGPYIGNARWLGVPLDGHSSGRIWAPPQGRPIVHDVVGRDDHRCRPGPRSWTGVQPCWRWA